MRKTTRVAALALLLLAGSAGAVEYPEIAEGLWQRHWTTQTNPGNKKEEFTQSFCHSHAKDKEAQALARNIKGCTYVSETLVGGKYAAEIQCKIGPTNLNSKATAIFKDSAVHSESVTTYDPALAGVSTESDVIDEKFVGACPAGMKPGDRMQPDGTILHSPR
jgi:hypothetical protein